MKPIAFELPDVGLREVSGKVYLDDDGFLIISLQNALFGEFDKEKREVRIEPAALKQIRLEKGVFKDRLVLRPENDRLLKIIPGDHVVEVELRVWRNRRNELRRLVDRLRKEAGMR